MSSEAVLASIAAPLFCAAFLLCALWWGAFSIAEPRFPNVTGSVTWGALPSTRLTYSQSRVHYRQYSYADGYLTGEEHER